MAPGPLSQNPQAQHSSPSTNPHTETKVSIPFSESVSNFLPEFTYVFNISTCQNHVYVYALSIQLHTPSKMASLLETKLQEALASETVVPIHTSIYYQQVHI